MSTTDTDTTNPVVRETSLYAVPGWVVREYADGTFDAAQVNGPAVSPVEQSFQAALHFAKHGEPRLMLSVHEAVRLLNAHCGSDAVARSLSDQLVAECQRPSQDYGRLADRAVSYAERLRDR